MIEPTSLRPDKQKIEELRKILPEVFAEGKIDWEKLRATLGEDVHINNERYVLNWAGKSEAFKILQLPTSKTVVPQKKQSINFDATQNIFIEGENLEVLKVLQKSYFGKVKMIYIDPPYNTGSDSFIYPDKFAETKDEYEKRIGDKDEEGYMTKDGMFRKNSKENGQYHSNWLNMMYPRLFLAKNLLRKDGVIFISIDDNEVHNLRLLMNEVFGEENFVACLPTIMNLKGNNDQFGFAGTHEYTLVFLKNIEEGSIGQYQVSDDELKDWQEDEYGMYKKGANLKATGTNAPREKRPNLFFPIYIKDNEISFEPKDGFTEIKPITNGQEMSWRWSLSKFKNEKHNLIINGSEDEVSIYKKQRPELSDLPSKKPKSIFYKPTYSSGNGTMELKNIFEGRFFSHPKPLSLLKDFIEISTKPNDLILDFFGGSGTIAHAVMQLNKEDGGKRKYICVQLPEKTDEKDEAYKAGYSTIADIAKERIRRASKQIEEQIKEEEKDPTFDFDKDKPKLDLGFKVFSLEESNFKQWQQLKEYTVEELSKQIDMFVDPVAEGATVENIMYELMLKSGKDLNSSIDYQDFYYSIDKGELVLMLESVSADVIKKVIAQNPQKVLALDRLFEGNDKLKTNTVLQMRDADITFKTI